MNVFPPTPDTPGSGKRTVFSSRTSSTVGTPMATPQTPYSLSTRAGSNDVSNLPQLVSKTDRLKYHLQFWKTSKPSAADVQYSWESLEKVHAKYLEALRKTLNVTNAWTDNIMPTFEESFEGTKDYPHVLAEHEQTAYCVKQLMMVLTTIMQDETSISATAGDIIHHFHRIGQYEKTFHENKRKQERKDQQKRQFESKYPNSIAEISTLDQLVKRCAANTFNSLGSLTKVIDQEILKVFQNVLSQVSTSAQNNIDAHKEITTKLCNFRPMMGECSELVNSGSMCMKPGTGFPSPPAAANPAVGRTRTRVFPGQGPMNGRIRHESVNSSIYSTDFAEDPHAQFHSHLPNDGALRKMPEELMNLSESVESLRLEADTPAWDSPYN